MEMVEIERYMSREVVVLSPTASIQEARNSMLREGISRLLVVEDGRPAGIITKKDIARRLAQPRAPWQRRPLDRVSVSRVMSTGLKTLPPEAKLKDAAGLIMKENVSSIPVVRDGRLLGIITLTDLVRAFSHEFEGVYRNGELMSREVITASRYHSLYHIVGLMRENNISRVVIAEGKRAVGMVTVTDLSFVELSDPELGMRMKEVVYVRKPSRSSRASYRYVKHSPLTAEDVMTEELITTVEDEDTARTASVMLENDISSLPVIKKEHLVGILTKKDIVQGIVGK